MKILVTGGYGFIGAHVVTGLAAAGHNVVGCGRNTELGKRLLPEAEWIACDFNRDTDPAAWLPRLEGVAAVVNCAGILQGGLADDIDAIHRQTPAALFEACNRAGIRRVVQISALGIDGASRTRYAKSKNAGDEALMATELDWVVLRPSLLHARDAYGGTALFRGLAAMPFVIPLPGAGKQLFQPIHMDDFVRSVLRLVEPDAPARVLLEPVGPEPMTLRRILIELRRWLGLPAAPTLTIPMPLVRVAALVGDILHWLGMRGSLRSTALRQMERENTADQAPFVAAVGFTPRGFAESLRASPAGVQDRWHARLVLVRPILRLVLAMFWVASGLITAFEPARSEALSILARAGFQDHWAAIALWSGVTVDIALGGLIIIDRYARFAAAAMIAVSLGYLAILGITLPELWLDPLGSLLKTLPAAAAALVMLVLSGDR